MIYSNILPRIICLVFVVEIINIFIIINMLINFEQLYNEFFHLQNILYMSKIQFLKLNVRFDMHSFAFLLILPSNLKVKSKV